MMDNHSSIKNWKTLLKKRFICLIKSGKSKTRKRRKHWNPLEVFFRVSDFEYWVKIKKSVGEKLEKIFPRILTFPMITNLLPGQQNKGFTTRTRKTMHMATFFKEICFLFLDAFASLRLLLQGLEYFSGAFF